MEVKKSFYTTVSHRFDLQHVEDVACDLCGGEEYKALWAESGFSIRQCRACSLVYVSPQPAAKEFARFYDGMYVDPTVEDSRARSLGYAERHISRLIQRKRPQGGKFLDIGCGYGRLLQEMEGLPWQCTGLELSEAALEYARAHSPGATFVQGSIEDCDFSEAKQDCIVMIGVLEHVKSPTKTLERVATWLNPGGLLLLQVPYIAPYIRLKRWIPLLPVNFEAPRHLFDFSPATMRRFLDQTGYTDVELRVTPPYASPSALSTALIWGVKAVGFALYGLSGGHYIYPFTGALLASTTRP